VAAAAPGRDRSLRVRRRRTTDPTRTGNFKLNTASLSGTDTATTQRPTPHNFKLKSLRLSADGDAPRQCQWPGRPGRRGSTNAFNLKFKFKFISEPANVVAQWQ